jgi:hypothetical protein
MEHVREEKTETEQRIEKILRETVWKEDYAELAGFLAVLEQRVDQTITGQWSENYPTYSPIRKMENSDEAHRWVSGFIWGLAAAGVIGRLDRDKMLEEMLKVSYKIPIPESEGEE